MFPRRPSPHRGWAHGPWDPDLGPQPCSWGAFHRGVGLWAGLFLQVLDDPTSVMLYVCFSLQPRSSTSFQVGGGWGGTKGSLGGAVAVGDQGAGAAG